MNIIAFVSQMKKKIYYFPVLLVITWSCIEKDVYEGDSQHPEDDFYGYLYPYGNEAHDIVAEIALLLTEAPKADQIITEIPVLKYNKSWLFLLTQDDCTHSAYSTTWAAMNGKPLSNNYYYGAEQLAAVDLPPDYFTLNKTLGSTDGTGNEIRFAFTTTLTPEMEWMENEPPVNIGFSRNYYRFYMMSGLTWNNVAEMLAYDAGIAFHDLNTNSVNNKDSLLKHFDIAQKISIEKLSGRGLKVLAEPNGNHNYLLAGTDYPSIRIMTAQNTKSGGPVVEPHFPYRVESDLEKAVLQRTFYNNTFEITARIENELKKNKEEREAIHVGIHGTNVTFAQFLLWLNNSYGKDGDDSVWVPSFEEYYEYNYYRVNSTIEKEINGDTLKLRITLPSEQYFYYPSVTVNLSGITLDQISRVISNDAVTGLSYASYNGGVMLNIDCRRFLFEHALHFVEKYLKSSIAWDKDDAIYFVERLKESPKKDELRKRIPGYTNK
jgi:hypothetical protein